MSAPLFDHATEGAVFDAISTASAVDVGRARVVAEQSGLVAADFHLPAHAELWDVTLGLLRQGQPADLLLVEAATKGSKAIQSAGGRKFLVPLFVGQRDELSLPGLAQSLRDLALRRRMVDAARKLANAAQTLSVDATAALSEGSGALAALTRRGNSVKALAEYLDGISAHMDAVARGEVEPVIPTGIEMLDKAIGGLQPTLTVIGAQPGVGKSALLASISHNLALRGVKVGVFSMEDEGSWMAWRLLSHQSGIGQSTLRHRRMYPDTAQHIAESIGKLWQPFHNILVDDRSGLSAAEVVMGARDMVLNHGCRAVFVDHLGELRYPNGRRDRFDLDVAEGLSDLRSIAKSYGVPVVCAVHLTRKSDDGPTPKLTSFANSAAIERQARVALGLTRQPGKDELLVHVLKQTNGRAGMAVQLNFNGPAALVANEGGRIIEPEEAAQ